MDASTNCHQQTVCLNARQRTRASHRCRAIHAADREQDHAGTNVLDGAEQLGRLYRASTVRITVSGLCARRRRFRVNDKKNCASVDISDAHVVRGWSVFDNAGLQ